jgi:hypothetical protein
MRTYDVIFLSYDEPNAEENWQRLLLFHPEAKRVSGIEGIYNAFQKCAEVAEHERFYLVDADSWILDDFRFRAPRADLPPGAFFWLARNAVNGLVSMNGGIKLISKTIVRSMKSDAVDKTTSTEGSKSAFSVVASENRFNSSPFLSWRAGFRECAKTAGGIFVPSEAQRERVLMGQDYKLMTWQTKGSDRPHGKWAMLGARQGARYGIENRDNRENLLKINEFEWLRQRFETIDRETFLSTPVSMPDRTTRASPASAPVLQANRD